MERDGSKRKAGKRTEVGETANRKDRKGSREAIRARGLVMEAA